MLSAGTILMVLVRALPRCEEEEISKRGVFERLVASGIPERVDAVIRAFSIKSLRKSKVLLLKIENFVTARLKKMNAENGDSKIFPDLREIPREKNFNDSERPASLYR